MPPYTQSAFQLFRVLIIACLCGNTHGAFNRTFAVTGILTVNWWTNDVDLFSFSWSNFAKRLELNVPTVVFSLAIISFFCIFISFGCYSVENGRQLGLIVHHFGANIWSRNAPLDWKVSTTKINRNGVMNSVLTSKSFKIDYKLCTKCLKLELVSVTTCKRTVPPSTTNEVFTPGKRSCK